MIEPKWLPSNVEQLSLVTEYVTGFEQGTQPDWIHETTKGTGAVTYETDGGGRARINTGTGATADGATLAFGSSGGSAVTITPNDWDVLVLSAIVGGEDDSSLAANRTALVKDGSNRAAYFRGFDTFNDGGSDTDAPAKDYTSRKVRADIVADIKRDIAYVVVGGMMSRIHDPVAADFTSSGWDVRFFRFDTKDTGTDRQAEIYHAALRGYVER